MVVVDSLFEDDGVRTSAETRAPVPLMDMSVKNLRESLAVSPLVDFTPASPPVPDASLAKLPAELQPPRSWANEKWAATLNKMTPAQWAAIMESCRVTYAELYKTRIGSEFPLDDLPLNVSRELLQESSVVRTIRKQVVKHTLDALESMASERPEDYATFWKSFGVFVKEGAARDFEYRERLAKLLRYESTSGDGLASLTEYVSRMKEGQPAIYYAIGESKRVLDGAPHLEGLRRRGYEVLFMCDPTDQWTVESLRTFEGKALVSAMGADLKIEEKEEDKKARAVVESALKGLLERARAVLGGRVKEVRFSDRLTDSPCCLVIAGDGTHGYVERLLREAGREIPKSERIFELNPRHAVVRNLEALVERSDPRVSEWLELLYDQALLTDGAPIDDPGAFSRRLTALLTTATASDPAAG